MVKKAGVLVSVVAFAAVIIIIFTNLSSTQQNSDSSNSSTPETRHNWQNLKLEYEQFINDANKTHHDKLIEIKLSYEF